MKDKTKVNSLNYVTIQGWMIKKLDLKGNELLVYAIIYGFTQDGEQTFNGSLQYLADWTNSTKESVRKCLKLLVEKKLIVKEDVMFNGVKFCKYSANLAAGSMVDGIQQSCMGVYNKVGGGIQQSCTNNIEDNIINKYNSNNKVSEKNKKNLYDLLQENGFILSPIHYEEVSKWEDNDLTRYVIKETVLKNIYNIKYISTVLSAYKRKNIRTIEQAKEEEEHFRQKPKQEKKKDSFDEILRQFVEEGESEDDQTRA